MKTSQIYLQNPDIIVKEEDEDGAIIYNPDTDQVKLLNPTGLFIWKLCNGTNGNVDIIQEINNSFSDIPENNVVNQMESFITSMLQDGFIGIV